MGCFLHSQYAPDFVEIDFYLFCSLEHSISERRFSHKELENGFENFFSGKIPNL